MVTITISGDPVSKARPRAAVIKGHAHMYTPKKSKNFEYMIRQRAEELFDTPIDGPVSVEIEIYLKRPKYMIWKTKPMPKIYHTKRSDLDNFIKAILDGLNQVAFHDDGQVAEIIARKWYQKGGKGPMTTIKIERLAEQSSEERCRERLN